MPTISPPLFNTHFLRSRWAREFEAFKGSPAEGELEERLKNWAEKQWLSESAIESNFIDLFFKQTFGYRGSGEAKSEKGFTLQQQYPVKDAGEQGGMGKADLALGYFGTPDLPEIPQVFCEFKDDRSGLDKPQKSRPSRKSPVDQCFDYLREKRSGLPSFILPNWAIVTDMNEFRLYWYKSRERYQRFFIVTPAGESTPSLLGDGEASRFLRFVFQRVFQPDMLLSAGGPSCLEKMVIENEVQERGLENEFYREYRAYRIHLFEALKAANPSYPFEKKLRKLVKLTQRILDRCLFVLYCEDMGMELNFPPQVLRKLLTEIATGSFYTPDGSQAWDRVKELFKSMRDGTPFGESRINRFNGGLFEDDPELETLQVPTKIFCAKSQVGELLLKYPETLLYFSAKYNFGRSDNGEGKTLTLTALGRIFEQSITDLEVMEARAENRESLAELTKRKTDGVYYTPEWVTQKIVEETVGLRLSEFKDELRVTELMDVADEEIEQYRTHPKKAAKVSEYAQALHTYAERLDDFKVVDPACGSGAFLIQAFIYLYGERQWIARELERLTGKAGLFDIHDNMRQVLANNLYGVDINPESVEITRLALWLQTTLPDRPLTSLDNNIRCGNSLVGSDFYHQLRQTKNFMSEDEVDRVNAFDWKKEFTTVFSGDDPGFDCVIGNPPYVKLQHFKRVQKDVARYLSVGIALSNGTVGGRLYESAQTGNFDLYLPFIEKGISLLNGKGRMGYIAPNLWLVNEYGLGLRKKIKATRRLDRWIDFKGFQVFSEAITYTALQFFTGSPVDKIRCLFAPKGKEQVAKMDWSQTTSFGYEGLPEDESWVFMPGDEMGIVERLMRNHEDLEAKTVQIFQGLITSADDIYHLQKTGHGRYLRHPDGKKDSETIEVEDGIMHPLVSGPEAKRYQRPITETYILFPYEVGGDRASILTVKEMEAKFPKAWKYLNQHEQRLRQREDGKFDDKEWYRFGRHQNIDKQTIPKLCVAQTVPEMRVFYDIKGEYYFNNVRVNGIIPKSKIGGWYLLGVLNSALIDYVFRRIAKPKANGYFEANKQFIAPLPIPEATPKERKQVGDLARTLQTQHTKKRDLMLGMEQRLTSAHCVEAAKDESWLWADVADFKSLAKSPPARLKGRDVTTWAKEERERRLDRHLSGIKAIAGSRITVALQHGELKLIVDENPTITGIFLPKEEAKFIAAQWRHKIRGFNITENFDPGRLVKSLLKLRTTSNQAIINQVVELDQEIIALEGQISKLETGINAVVYQLFGLSPAEIELIEKG